MMRRKSKILISAGLVVAAAAIIVPIVGPFTFFDELVPVMGPVLPKPNGVPGTASGSYNWKGAGLVWEWEKKFERGCIEWGTDSQSSFHVASLSPGDAGCEGADLHNGAQYIHDRLVFGAGGPWMGQEPCPFTVTSQQLAALQGLVREAKETAEPAIELPALRRIEARLEQANGAELVTYFGGGCHAREAAAREGIKVKEIAALVRAHGRQGTGSRRAGV